MSPATANERETPGAESTTAGTPTVRANKTDEAADRSAKKADAYGR